MYVDGLNYLTKLYFNKNHVTSYNSTIESVLFLFRCHNIFFVFTVPNTRLTKLYPNK